MAPVAPWGVYATNIAETSITAVWYVDYPSVLESQIRVWSCTSSGTKISLIADIPNITAYQSYCARNLYGGFTAGNWFMFEVRTGNSSGVSSYVSSGAFQMDGGGGGQEPTLPSEPWSVYATNIGTTSITAVWYCDETVLESEIKVYSCTSSGSTISYIADIPNIPSYDGKNTKYLQGGFTAGNWFIFKVRTGNSSGVSDYVWSDPFQMESESNPTPNKPTNVQATNITSNSITWSWSVDSTVSYVEAMIWDEDGGEPIQSTTTTSTTWTTYNLQPNSLYGFGIEAYNADGSLDSGYVFLDDIRTLGTIPNPPTNITISNITFDSATINWNVDSTALESEIYVYDYATNAFMNNFPNISTSTAGSYSKNISGFTAGKSYYVKIRTGNLVGVSNWTTSLVFTMLQNKANPPSDISIINIGSNSATIKWYVDSTAKLSEIYVYDYATDAFMTKASNIPTSSAGYYTYSGFTGFTAGKSYYVKIRTSFADTTGLSDWVTSSTFTTLKANPPTNIIIKNITKTSATIGWYVDNTAKLSEIWVYDEATNAFMNNFSNISTPSPGYYEQYINGFTAGKSYYVEVRTSLADTTGLSSWVRSPIFTMLSANPPTNINVINITDTTATVQWTVDSTGQLSEIYVYDGETSAFMNRFSNISTPTSGTYEQFISGFTQGKSYWVEVRTSFSDTTGLSNWVESSIFKMLSTPPTNVYVTSGINGIATVHFDWVSTATRMEATWDTINVNPNTRKWYATNTNVTSHDISGYEQGQILYVWVRAYGDSGYSAWTGNTGYVGMVQAPTNPSSSASSGYVTLQWTPNTATGVKTGIYYSTSSAVPQSYVGMVKIQSVPVKSVILGDSISVSQGASNSSKTWESRLGDAIYNEYSHPMDWRNKGLSGTLIDYCITRATEINDDYDCDAVFVCVGRNDRNKYTPYQFKQKYLTLIDNIRDMSPFIDIFCIVEPPMAVSDDSLFLGIRQAIFEVGNLRRVDVIDVWSAFPTGSSMNQYTVDGLHLNDVGYQMMTNYIFNYLNTKVNNTIVQQSLNSFTSITKKHDVYGQAGETYYLWLRSEASYGNSYWLSDTGSATIATPQTILKANPPTGVLTTANIGYDRIDWTNNTDCISNDVYVSLSPNRPNEYTDPTVNILKTSSLYDYYGEVGKTYYLWVRTVTSYGNSDWVASGGLPDSQGYTILNPYPDTPTNINVYNNPGYITVTWEWATTGTSATKVGISWQTENPPLNHPDINDWYTTSKTVVRYNITNSPDGVRYQQGDNVNIWVRAENGNGSSPWSLMKTGIIGKAVPPTEVTITPNVGNIYVTWVKNPESTSTDIYYSTSSTRPSSSTIETDNTTYSNYRIYGESGTIYYIWVRAVTPYGKSDWISYGDSLDSDGHMILFVIPNMPSFTSYTKTCGSITVNFTKGENADTTEIDLYERVDGVYTYKESYINIIDSFFTVTGLMAGTYYRFKGRSKSINNVYSNWTADYTTITLSLNPPTFTTPSNKTPTSFICKFTKHTNALSTEIELYRTSDDVLIQTYNTTESLQLMENLTSETPYYVRGRSISSDNVYSGWSSNYSISTTAYPTPTAPTFGTSTKTCGTLTVNFTKGTNAETTNLQIKTLSGAIVVGSVNGITETSYTFTGLRPSTYYYVTGQSVSLYNKMSGWSNTSNIMTLALKPPTFNSVYIKTQTSVTITFYKPSYSYLQGIDIFLYDDSQNLLREYINVDISVNTLTISDLSYGSTYYIKGRSVATDGTIGDLSDNFLLIQTEQAIIPEAPIIYSIWNIKTTSATISITKGINANLTNIYLFNSLIDATNLVLENNVGFWSITGNSQEVEGLTHFTNYYVRAISVSSTGNYSEWTSVAYFMTRPLDFDGFSWIVSGGEVETVKIGNDTYIAYIMPSSEWNNFTLKINEFRKFKNISNYTFTEARRDMDFSKDIINEAVDAIKNLGMSLLPVNSGDEISYDLLVNKLKGTLNSM